MKPSSPKHERDQLGRITRQQQTIEGSQEHQYAYDTAGHLTSHTVDGTTTTWGFDANGNRTTENGTVIATYDSEDRLQSWKGNTYTYNAAGDLQGKTTPGGATSYTYDTLGNLRQVNLPGGDEIQYIIDPLNRRIGKQKNGQRHYGLLYRDGLRPVAQLDTNGRIHAVFIYAEKANVPSAMLMDGNLYRIISDHLGSVRMVIDTGNNMIAQRMDYDAWGNVIHDTNPGFQPFGFAGGLYDPDTGLTRFGVRDYDAETGRWTAKDPIGFAGGDTNLYGYVLQDPVNFLDPLGLATQCETEMAVGLLLNKHPDIYKKVPSKIDATWYFGDNGGSYSFPANAVYYDSSKYAPHGTSILAAKDSITSDVGQYNGFLTTIAHEMLHAQQTTGEFYSTRREGKVGNIVDGESGAVDAFATKLAGKLLSEYIGSVKRCGCE